MNAEVHQLSVMRMHSAGIRTVHSHAAAIKDTVEMDIRTIVQVRFITLNSYFEGKRLPQEIGKI